MLELLVVACNVVCVASFLLSVRLGPAFGSFPCVLRYRISLIAIPVVDIHHSLFVGWLSCGS